MGSEICVGIVGMRIWTQLGLVLVVTPLVGGWGWFGKYGSKFEAEGACVDWVNAGPTKSAVRKEFRTRSRPVDWPSQFAPPLPRAWSTWQMEEALGYEPIETPYTEVEKREVKITYKVRTCMPDPATNQFLGLDGKSIRKRFKY